MIVTYVGNWAHILRMLHESFATGVQTSASFRGTVYDGKLQVEAYNEISYCREKRCSWGKLVYQYLVSKGCNRNLISQSQKEMCFAPRFCAPPGLRHLKEACYIDLKSAYLQIYKHLTWDLTFCPNSLHYRKGNIELSDFPYNDNKFARNALVGLAVSSKKSYWLQGNVVYKPYHNNMYNPTLAGYIYGVLNYVAYNAINRFNAIYYNTDGGIFSLKDAEKFGAFLASNSMEFSKKEEGEVFVYSAGFYEFNKFTAKMPYRPTNTCKLMNPVISAFCFKNWRS